MRISFAVVEPDLLKEFQLLTDVVLRTSTEVVNGLFIAEGLTTIHRAHDAGLKVRTILCEEKWVETLPQFPAEVPIIIANKSELETITGYIVHRGALASYHRPPQLDWQEVISQAESILILEGLVNHTNVGAIIRSAAAFGVHGILIDSHCADPLYRRAIRTSMGTIFATKWARYPSPVELSTALNANGFEIIALSPNEHVASIKTWIPAKKNALILGTEGEGISMNANLVATHRLRIPMASGIDSLNVSAAAAVALYEFMNRVSG